MVTTSTGLHIQNSLTDWTIGLKAPRKSIDDALLNRPQEQQQQQQYQQQQTSPNPQLVPCLANSSYRSGRVRSQSDPSRPSEGRKSLPSAACENAAEELILTEIRYLRRLRLLHNHYYPRLKLALPPSNPVAAQFELVFNNIFGTFCEKHRELLADLQRAVSFRIPRVGQLMLEFAKNSLGLYSEYCINYKGYVGLVSDCLKETSAFRTACLKAQAECPDPRDRKLQVTSHMIEPVHRPLRYPLILSAYIKQIGCGHPDWQDAKDALETIKEVTGELDSQVQELKNYQKILSELQDLNFPDHLQPAKNSFSQSSFLLSSRVTKISSKNKPQTRHILLSSGWLLLCEVGPLNRRNVQRAVSLNEGRMNGARRNSLTVCRDAKLSADYPNSMRLWTNGKSYDLIFASEDEFKKWVEAFEKLDLLRETGYGVPGDEELFPWTSILEADLGNLEPAKIKDNDVSQCQACSETFTTANRRHHCRLCGGIYCQSCSSYKVYVKWSRSDRSCLFCKERISNRDGLPSVLMPTHQEMIKNFYQYRWDRFSRWLVEPESAPILLEGYLRVRIEIPDPRKVSCPPELRSNRLRLWCSTDGCVLRLRRGKLDRATAHELLLLMEVKVEWIKPGKAILLTVKEGKLESCSLRADSDSSGISLLKWFECLRSSADALGSAALSSHGRQMSF